MATYKEIKGVTVQTRDEDPNLFVGSWSSGGNLNTDRWGNAGAGTLTSGLSIDGLNPDSTDVVEEYNGTSWTEIAENNTARNFGVGTGANAEAALFFSGFGPPLSSANESWNGSAWTETTDLNTARKNACGAGTSTAAICIAGYTSDPPGTPNRLNQVEVWNGSSWTEVAEVNTSGGDAASAGTSTDSIKAGTSNGPGTTVETWDGSSFTETTELNTGRYYLRGSGPSGQTDTLVFGGTPPYTGKTEKWNGSTWTEVNDMSTARGAFASTNTTAASAWAAGGTTDGGTPGDTAATEEFAFPSSPILVEGMVFLSGGTTLKGFGRAAGIPAGTWASGPALNTARSELTGSQNGTQDAMLAFGTSPNIVEQYNGSSWTEVADTSSGKQQAGGLGTSTAAILCFGSPPAGGGATPTEEWNGSSWTEKNDGNTGRYVIGACGTTTAGLAAGGLTFPPAVQKANTESWDGTSWTEVNDMNTASRTYNISGVQTSSISAGRGEPNISNVETWDGTSWTEVAEINTTRREAAMSGFDNGNALLAGGDSGPPIRANTEFWNGTSWTEINDLGTARKALTGGGSAAKGIVFGGTTGSASAATEEFTADATLSTVTVS